MADPRVERTEDGSAAEYDHFDLFTISEITLNKGGLATYK